MMSNDKMRKKPNRRRVERDAKSDFRALRFSVLQKGWMVCPACPACLREPDPARLADPTTGRIGPVVTCPSCGADFEIEVGTAPVYRTFLSKERPLVQVVTTLPPTKPGGGLI